MSAVSGADTDAVQRLFVYGSLAPGRPNAHLLAELAGTWEPATVQGRLLGHGWGAAMGFPALVPDDRGTSVPGFLLTSEQLPDHWARLDEVEGAEYRRVVLDVCTEDARVVPAHVYVHASL